MIGLFSKLISFLAFSSFFMALGGYLTFNAVTQHSDLYCRFVQSKNLMEFFDGKK